MLMRAQETCQTTSNLGHMQKPSVQALLQDLNRHHYISINHSKNELEQKILNLHKVWKTDLTLADECSSINESTVQDMLALAYNNNKPLKDERPSSWFKNLGKQDSIWRRFKRSR